MSDRIKELMDEQHREMVYPLLVGAIAVSKPWTLITSVGRCIRVLESYRDELDSVPERFQTPIIKLDGTHQYDLTTKLLVINEDGVHWTDYYADYEGRYNRYFGDQYVMEDKDAEWFIAKEGFTPEELDWLWEFAQKLHMFRDKSIERR